MLKQFHERGGLDDSPKPKIKPQEEKSTKLAENSSNQVELSSQKAKQVDSIKKSEEVKDKRINQNATAFYPVPGPPIKNVSQFLNAPIFINNQSSAQQLTTSSNSAPSGPPIYSTDPIPLSGTINNYTSKTKYNPLKTASSVANLTGKQPATVPATVLATVLATVPATVPATVLTTVSSTVNNNTVNLPPVSSLKSSTSITNLTIKPASPVVFKSTSVDSNRPASAISMASLTLKPPSPVPVYINEPLSAPTYNNAYSAPPQLQTNPLINLAASIPTAPLKKPPIPLESSSQQKSESRPATLYSTMPIGPTGTLNQFCSNQTSFRNINEATTEFLHVQTDFVSKVETKSDAEKAPSYIVSQNFTRREILSASPQPDPLTKQPGSPGSIRRDILSTSPQPGSPGSTRRDILSTSPQPGSPVLARKNLPPPSPQSGSPSMVRRDISLLQPQQSSPGSIRRDLPAMTAQSSSPNRIRKNSPGYSQSAIIEESSIQQFGYSDNILKTQSSLVSIQNNNQVLISNENKAQNSEILNIKSKTDLNEQVSEPVKQIHPSYQLISENKNINSQVPLVKKFDKHEIGSMNQSEDTNDISYEKEESLVKKNIEQHEKANFAKNNKTINNLNEDLTINENNYEKIDDHIQTKDEKIETVIQKETENIVAPIGAATTEEPDTSEVTPTGSPRASSPSDKQDLTPTGSRPTTPPSSTTTKESTKQDSNNLTLAENSNVSPVVDVSESVKPDSKLLSVVENTPQPDTKSIHHRSASASPGLNKRASFIKQSNENIASIISTTDSATVKSKSINASETVASFDKSPSANIDASPSLFPAASPTVYKYSALSEAKNSRNEIGASIFSASKTTEGLSELAKKKFNQNIRASSTSRNSSPAPSSPSPQQSPSLSRKNQSNPVSVAISFALSPASGSTSSLLTRINSQQTLHRENDPLQKISEVISNSKTVTPAQSVLSLHNEGQLNEKSFEEALASTREKFKSIESLNRGSNLDISKLLVSTTSIHELPPNCTKPIRVASASPSIRRKNSAASPVSVAISFGLISKAASTERLSQANSVETLAVINKEKLEQKAEVKNESKPGTEPILEAVEPALESPIDIKKEPVVKIKNESMADHKSIMQSDLQPKIKKNKKPTIIKTIMNEVSSFFHKKSSDEKGYTNTNIFLENDITKFSSVEEVVNQEPLTEKEQPVVYFAPNSSEKLNPKNERIEPNESLIELSHEQKELPEEYLI